jgi:hypothetical protein
MATESAKEAGQDPVEAFTDDLIREFFAEAGQSAKSGRRGRGGGMAALLETVMASDGAAATSLLERLLIAQTIASELAQAIAPALAESLTPEIMKALEQYAGDEHGRKGPATATRARRTEGK